MRLSHLLMTCENETMKISLQETVGKGYAEFWNDQHRYRVVKGSRGSKKSKTTALNIIYRLLKYPQANALCVRRYTNTLRDSMFSDLKWAIHKFGLDNFFKCTVSPLEITYIKTGQKILFRGFDDPLKITSISVDLGYLCLVWIEEAYEIISEDDFNKLDLSIRGELPAGYFKQLTLTFNPWNESHWLKRRFFDAPDGNTFSQTTTWECNEWLDEGDRALFLNMKENNPARYAVEGLGDWGITAGQIFQNLTIRQITGDEREMIENHDRVYNGVDWGWYPDIYAFVRVAYFPAQQRLFIFAENTGNYLANETTAAWIKDNNYDDVITTCDSSENKSILDYRDHGINARKALKGPGSIEYSMKWLCALKEIIIDPKTCPCAAGEFTCYHHEKNKAGEIIAGYPDKDNHCIDAVRYATEQYWTKRQKQ